MRRRTVLTSGGVIVSGTIAGCLGFGGDDEEPESTPTSEPEEDDQTTQTTETAGELSLSAEPSATEIDWGDDYSVDVTVQAGDESVTQLMTALVYRKEGDSSWAGVLGDSEMRWNLDAGESATKTIKTRPPSTGGLTVGLMNMRTKEAADQWELSVQPPTAALGETISYYDGLDMTVGAEVHDSLEFELDYGGNMNEAETGTFSVSVRNGKWVKVNIVAENTKQEGKVSLPGKPRFSGIVGGGTQLKQNQPRSLGEGVGEGSIYAIGDGPSDIDDARMEMHKGGTVQQDGYWYPPSEIIGGAVEKGWLVYAVQEDLSDDAAIEIRLDRQSGVDVRAEWTNE